MSEKYILSQEEYNEMMAYFGHKIYALQVGHHMVCEDKEYSIPTIWPERVDTKEMRLKWVIHKNSCNFLIDYAKSKNEPSRVLGGDNLFQSMVDDIMDYYIGLKYIVTKDNYYGKTVLLLKL